MKIVTFGEIMLRLSTKGFSRFVQSQEFDINYGGGEANVAVSLANYNNESFFVTKLPDNDISKSAIKSLKANNVNTKYISFGGDRLGIYFLETGASMRPSKVIYDRKFSSISKSTEEDFDFDEIFKGKDLFHFTGITPALSPSCQKVVKKALEAAKKNNVLVSVDLNYRKKLWTVKKAREAMKELVKYVDIIIGNEEDFDKCLGFKLENTNVDKGELNINDYKEMFRKIKKDYNVKYIASSLRESYSASDNGWSALLFDGTTFYKSKKYNIRLVDRVGGGDSFAAGLIHGLLNFNDLQKTIEFAVGASALKQTIPGDYNYVSEEEVLNLIKGDTSGRVSR